MSRTMRPYIFLLLSSPLWLAAFASTVAGQVPHKLSVQAVLEDGGVPVDDPSATLTFRLWGDPTSRDPLDVVWTETQTDVAVENGLMTAMLGGDEPLGVGLFSQPLWLGVTVGGADEPELEPRIELTAAPYALSVVGADSTVTSLNGLMNDVVLQGTGGATVTTDGNTITISAGSSGVVSDIQGLQNTDGALDITDPNGPTPTINLRAEGIGTEHLTNHAVTGTKLADGAVTNAKLASGAVTGLAIADGAVRAGSNISVTRDASNNYVISADGAEASWLLGGNTGTAPGSHFIGTTDERPLEIKVGGRRAMRYEPRTQQLPDGSEGAVAPNLIGGWSGNAVEPSLVGVTISGGGAPGGVFGAEQPNMVNGDYGSIGGGSGNAAGTYSSVGGGLNNVASSSAYATVGGGNENRATGRRATVGGGGGNGAEGEHATIGGGRGNGAEGAEATVGGGAINRAQGTGSTVGGGRGNTAHAVGASVAGGAENDARGHGATVGGGGTNEAVGFWSTVPGGSSNTAAGNYSFAAGRRAEAVHDGAFVWADSDSDSRDGRSFVSTGTDQFLIRATGGVGIGTNDPSAILHLQNDDPEIALMMKASASWTAALQQTDASIFSIVNGGQKRLVIHPDGKVGVGTTDPTTHLALNAGLGGKDVGITQGLRGGIHTMELTTSDENGDQATRILLRGDGNSDIEFYRGLRGSETRTVRISGADGAVVTEGQIRPGSDATYSLGQAGKRWRDVWASDGTINTSDRRAKQDILHLKYGLREVMRLRPVIYRWIDRPQAGRRLGLVAQDVEQVVPEVVRRPQHADELLGISYAELVPLLVKAVQEQQEQIRKLNEHAAQLRAHISRLDSNGPNP